MLVGSSLFTEPRRCVYPSFKMLIFTNDPTTITTAHVYSTDSYFRPCVFTRFSLHFSSLATYLLVFTFRITTPRTLQGSHKSFHLLAGDLTVVAKWCKVISLAHFNFPRNVWGFKRLSSITFHSSPSNFVPARRRDFLSCPHNRHPSADASMGVFFLKAAGSGSHNKSFSYRKDKMERRCR